MTDVYSTQSSDRFQDAHDFVGNDVDSANLKSPVSETDSGSFVDSLESPNPSLAISRPLSRSSVTSGLSVTATKDGVEGKRIKRTGIPNYPLNLINKMYTNYARQLHIDPEGREGQDDTDEFASVQSIKSATSLIPQYDPNDRDADLSSVMSSDYEDQSMDGPRSFGFTYDNSQTQSIRAQEGGFSQIAFENEQQSTPRKD